MGINTSTMRRGAAYEGIQRDVLPVSDGDAGTGNESITISIPARELFLSNDSTTDNLTFRVIGDNVDFTYTLLPGETIDERFLEFNNLVISAVGAWRWYVRSGRIT